MDGLLLIDKPAGWTSFDVVAKVRGTLARYQLSVVSSQFGQTTDNRQQVTPSTKVKVGHTGTLDPLATGLLVLVLGSYCKRAQEFSKLDKTYEVTMKLGETSTTGDREGTVTAYENAQVTKSVRPHDFCYFVEETLQEFVGEIWQTPPVYSAVKVGGQRAYKLARAGKEVKLEPRKVTIHDIRLTDYSYPEVKFTAHVSSGTYIRSLVEDLGTKLGTGAYMSDLRRTTVGQFSLQDALPIDQLSAESAYNRLVAFS